MKRYKTDAMLARDLRPCRVDLAPSSLPGVTGGPSHEAGIPDKVWYASIDDCSLLAERSAKALNCNAQDDQTGVQNRFTNLFGEREGEREIGATGC